MSNTKNNGVLRGKYAAYKVTCKSPGCTKLINRSVKSGMCAPHAKEAGLRTGTSAEQRSKFKLCGAKTAHGSGPCRNFAGQQTDHFGFGRCYKHGGATKLGTQGAVKEQIEEEMVKYVEMVEVDPGEALQALLQMSAGFVKYLRDSLNKLDGGLNTTEARAVLKLFDVERDRLHRIAATSITTGIDARRLHIEEAKLAMLAAAMKNAAMNAGLSEDQQRTLGAELRKELQKLEAEGAAGKEALVISPSQLDRRRNSVA